MVLYIYADETGFELSSDEDIIGSGLLVTNSPVKNIVVTEALKNLKSDFDIRKEEFEAQDTRTLERGYFHASEDSQNAHSHFCRSIVKHLKGNFVYSYFNPFKDMRWRKRRTLSDLRELTLKLSTMDLFYTIEKIIFTIEERRDFSIDRADEWIEELYKSIESSIYRVPSIPSTFPNIKLKVDIKENPGLQVTDFILWSINRSRRTPPHDDWLKRLKLKELFNYNDVEGPMQGGTYILGEEIRIPLLKYPFPVKDPDSNEEAIKSYLLIERFLRYISKQPFPNHAIHHKDKVLNVVEKLSNEPTSVELIREASSIFIRLFDTLPLYNGLTGNDKDKWSKLLTARKMAALSLRKRLGESINYCHAIARRRYKIIRENPEILCMEPFEDI